MDNMNNDVQDIIAARKLSEDKYVNARRNLLLMLAFTVLNAVLAAFGSDVMMLFSATVPYIAMLFGLDSLGETVPMVFFFGIAGFAMLMYLLCWIFSKRHYAWLVVAMVMFAFDTVALVGVYLLVGDISGIVDFVFHVWVMYYLIIGVIHGAKLGRMPVPPAPVPMPAEE